MTRVCYTHRGRGLAHPAPLTRALLPRAANCLDCERLLSLAFDKFSFLRSFPQARVDTLRRKQVRAIDHETSVAVEALESPATQLGKRHRCA